MSKSGMPTKVNKYNVYNTGNKLLGMGDELTLPDFESSSETISGAGILGEIDDPTLGYFGNQEMEIPFRVMDQEAVVMLDQSKAVQLTIRGGTQTLDSSGNIDFTPIRVVVGGRMSKFSPGKLKAGSPMEASVTLTILNILIELDGKRVVELDKLGDVYKVNNVDVLAKIKEMC